MTKNSKWTLFLFAVLIATAIFSTIFLNNMCKTFSDEYDVLEEMIIDEDWEEGYDYCVSLLEKQHSSAKITAMFINHEEVDIMEQELYKLSQYIKLKNKDLSLAAIHSIKFSIENIRKINEYSLQNIF